MRIIVHFRFQMLKFVVKTVILSLLFIESHYLVRFHQFGKFHSTVQKNGVLERLLYRSVKICCVFKTLQLEIDHLKNIIRKISYLLTFIDSFRVLIYLLKNCIHVKSLFRMCLKGVSFRQAFLGKSSFQVRKKLQILFTNKLTS